MIGATLRMVQGMILQAESGFQCSRPFYDILLDGEIFDWMACPYTIGGLGLTGLGGFIWFGGFVGLKNWSESWTLPVTWTAIVTPAMSAALLPGTLIRRIAGVLTVAVALLMVGVYFWMGRS